MRINCISADHNIRNWMLRDLPFRSGPDRQFRKYSYTYEGLIAEPFSRIFLNCREVVHASGCRLYSHRISFLVGFYAVL